MALYSQTWKGPDEASLPDSIFQTIAGHLICTRDNQRAFSAPHRSSVTPSWRPETHTVRRWVWTYRGILNEKIIYCIYKGINYEAENQTWTGTLCIPTERRKLAIFYLGCQYLFQCHWFPVSSLRHRVAVERRFERRQMYVCIPLDLGSAPLTGAHIQHTSVASTSSSALSIS